MVLVPFLRHRTAQKRRALKGKRVSAWQIERELEFN
jgi:hypothetical protein